MTFDDLCNIKQHGDPLLEPTTALQNIIFDIYTYLTCVHNNLHEVTYTDTHEYNQQRSKIITHLDLSYMNMVEHL